jgi:hypothetical protein
VRVHLAREHALELELLDLAVDALEVGLDGPGRAFVGFGLGEVEQLARLGQVRGEPVERADDALEPGALPAEILGTVRRVCQTAGSSSSRSTSVRRSRLPS